ncbi:unnamed protein product [Ixodes persulcatus]
MELFTKVFLGGSLIFLKFRYCRFLGQNSRKEKRVFPLYAGGKQKQTVVLILILPYCTAHAWIFWICLSVFISKNKKKIKTFLVAVLCGAAYGSISHDKTV